MQFKIEQIAITPLDPVAAKQLLKDMGAVDWVEDNVMATGEVLGHSASNQANLSFNYDLIDGKEFEILEYVEGANWTNRYVANRVSHLGMHCSAEDLVKWREFFNERKIQVAQEVFTDCHTNPAIAGKRSYNYVIFNTYGILGVDLKFIVRINK